MTDAWERPARGKVNACIVSTHGAERKKQMADVLDDLKSRVVQMVKDAPHRHG